MTKRGMKTAVNNKQIKYHRSVYHVTAAIWNER